MILNRPARGPRLCLLAVPIRIWERTESRIARVVRAESAGYRWENLGRRVLDVAERGGAPGGVAGRVGGPGPERGRRVVGDGDGEAGRVELGGGALGRRGACAARRLEHLDGGSGGGGALDLGGVVVGR